MHDDFVEQTQQDPQKAEVHASDSAESQENEVEEKNEDVVDAGRQDIGDNVSHSGAHVPEERESEEGNEPTAKKQRLHLIKASVNNIM